MKIQPKSWKILLKSVQNPWKIDKNRCLGRFGPFSVPNRGQVGARTLWASSRVTQKSIFGPKMAPQGSLFGPPQIPKWLQNRTFEARSALGPSKNGLGEGFWNKSKNGWKNDWKKDQKSCKNWSKIHWKIHTFSNLRFLVFCKESYVKMRILQVGGIENLIKMMKKTMPKWGCQKVEKSMPKGSPKVMFFGPKSTLGAPRVDLFSIFIDFWESRKNLIFRWRSGATKKQAKMEPWRPKGGKSAQGYPLGGAFRHRTCPREGVRGREIPSPGREGRKTR